MAWYSSPSGTTNATSATSIHFIGRSRSVSATTVPALLRAAAKPLLMPEASDLRSANSVHTPPTSIVPTPRRSEEHTSELQSLMRPSYAVFCLNKKNTYTEETNTNPYQH